MSTQNDPLRALAEDALRTVKQANINIGGEQAVPEVFGSHGAGMTSPNPAAASMSALGEGRSAANAANYQTPALVGSDFTRFVDVLPERYETIRNAIHGVPMMGQEKMASAGQPEPDHLTKMANSGNFPNGHYPSPEENHDLVVNSLNKTASAMEVIIPTMIERGLVPKEYVPYLLPQSK